MVETLRVLMVDDSEDDVILAGRTLRRLADDLTIERVDSEPDLRRSLRQKTWDVILCDCKMPGFTAGEALGMYHEYGLSTPFLVVSGKVPIEDVADLMRAGAHDFVPKEDTARLVSSVRTALKDAEARRARLQAERDLSETRDLLALILETASEGIYAVDTDGNCTTCNAACAQALGFDGPADLVGQDMHECAHRADRTGRALSKTQGSIWKACHAGQVSHEESGVLWRRDGGSFPAEYWTRPLCKDGATIGAVTSFVDITERVDAERKMVQMHKMRALGQMTGGLAHDFNNILTVIMNSLEMLEEDREFQQMDKRLTKAVTLAFGASKRGRDLIRSLLAFSRREPAEVTLVDVGEVVHRVVQMARHVIEENIALSVDVPEAPCLVMVDDGKLESALLNLILNSRDAIADGGSIRVTAQAAELGPGFKSSDYDFVPGNYVRIAVADSGCGMGEEELTRATEPFYTTKPVGEGTGLGLSGAFGFAKQYNGFLELQSEPGKGTVVELYLPTDRDHTGTTATGSDRPGRVDVPGLVLLVEDDGDVRSSIEIMLERLGCEVIGADCGTNALTALSGRPDIALVLTDMVMPGGMNGLDFARTARQKHPDLPVIFMSGHVKQDLQQEADAVPRTLCLPKPFILADLASAIESVYQTPDTVRPAVNDSP